jgi:hypothetical protein
VIFTRVSGPGGNTRIQPGEGDIGGGGTWACATEERSNKAMVAAVANKTFRIYIDLPPTIPAAKDAPNSAEHENGANEDK